MNKPAVVYHYTSAETLLKIIDSESIWATNLRYLNDVTEADHCIGMMRRRLPEFLAISDSPFKGELEVALRDVGFQTWNTPYVASFSLLQDSLPQWRSYCSGGNGVSIGFRTTALKKSRLSDKPVLGVVGPVTSNLKRVTYLGDSDWHRTDGLIESCLSQLARWKKVQDRVPAEVRVSFDDDSFLQLVIKQHACVVKHDSFSNEKEFRLLAPNPFWAGEKALRFRSSKTTIVPYLPVRLPEWGKSRSAPPKFAPRFDDYFIQEVVVGPTPNPTLTKDSLNAVCFHAGSRGSQSVQGTVSRSLDGVDAVNLG